MLSFNLVYRLPFHGNRLVEGWQVSGIEAFRSGIPFSVGIGYDRALFSNNFAAVRPDVIAGCDQAAGQNPATLVQPGLQYTPGRRYRGQSR